MKNLIAGCAASLMIGALFTSGCGKSGGGGSGADPTAECKAEETGASCQVSDALGNCSFSVETCVDGKFECVQTIFPFDEVCDLEDNNCDGEVDEGCSCAPNGATETCGTNVGECQVGTRSCDDGGWLECNSIQPIPELCDGLDNDCDGFADNDNPEGGGTCDLAGQMGPCASGIEECRQAGIECIQTVFPSIEVCDARDNNCSGIVDDIEEAGQSCRVPSMLGACAEGRLECRGGVSSCKQLNSPQPEICGDGIDNDCDGNLDNGCECLPKQVRSCGSDIGYCMAGTQACGADGRWNTACVGERRGRSETCNNIDDNCDGTVDENVKRICYSGTDSTRGIGECHDGFQECVNGLWNETCQSEQRPVSETCDEVDNNCDGSVDESGTWPASKQYEPNNNYTNNAKLIRKYSRWQQEQTVSSTFGDPMDRDAFRWELTSYTDADETIRWKCTLSGLAPGQTALVLLGVHTGGYPGTGPWQFKTQAVLGNGRSTRVIFNSPQGPYGMLARLVPADGFHDCSNHDYTLTCALEH